MSRKATSFVIDEFRLPTWVRVLGKDAWKVSGKVGGKRRARVWGKVGGKASAAPA